MHTINRIEQTALSPIEQLIGEDQSGLISEMFEIATRLELQTFRVAFLQVQLLYSRAPKALQCDIMKAATKTKQPNSKAANICLT